MPSLTKHKPSIKQQKNSENQPSHSFQKGRSHPQPSQLISISVLLQGCVELPEARGLEIATLKARADAVETAAELAATADEGDQNGNAPGLPGPVILEKYGRSSPGLPWGFNPMKQGVSGEICPLTPVSVDWMIDFEMISIRKYDHLEICLPGPVILIFKDVL